MEREIAYCAVHKMAQVILVFLISKTTCYCSKKLVVNSHCLFHHHNILHKSL